MKPNLSCFVAGQADDERVAAYIDDHDDGELNSCGCIFCSVASQSFARQPLQRQ